MTLHLVVGLPGAGKTTRARELEVAHRALRLTPDEWQMAVFDQDGPGGWRATERVGHRDRIEGKLIEVGLRAAVLGLDVVLDFGLWSRAERWALRAMAASLGVPARVVYLPVEQEEQRRRVRDRFAAEPGQFDLTDAELVEWHAWFEAPDEAELVGGPVPAPPPGHTSWWGWAVERWPSLPDRDPQAGGAPPSGPPGPGRAGLA